MRWGGVEYRHEAFYMQGLALAMDNNSQSLSTANSFAPECPLHCIPMDLLLPNWAPQTLLLQSVHYIVFQWTYFYPSTTNSPCSIISLVFLVFYWNTLSSYNYCMRPREHKIGILIRDAYSGDGYFPSFISIWDSIL